MNTDAEKAWDAIRRASRLDASISKKMSSVIKVCAASYPHRDWAKLAALPYDDDVRSLAPWIHTVLRRQPPKASIKGLWFGLSSLGLEKKTLQNLGSGT